MKKLLLLGLAGLWLTLHYRWYPPLNDWLDERYQQITGDVQQSMKVSVRVDAQRLRQALADKLPHFSEAEQQVITQISTSEKQLQDFYQRYCGGSHERHPVLYGSRLQLVCRKAGELLTW